MLGSILSILRKKVLSLLGVNAGGFPWRRSAALLVIGVWGHAVANAAPRCPQPKEGLRLEVRAPNVPLALADPLPLTVTLHNDSAETISVKQYMEPQYYWLNIKVLDANRMVVPWIGPELKIIDQGWHNSLEPGYFWGKKIEDLRSLFKFSDPGRYEIQATYGVSPMGKCPLGRIISNRTFVEVR